MFFRPPMSLLFLSGLLCLWHPDSRIRATRCRNRFRVPLALPVPYSKPGPNLIADTDVFVAHPHHEFHFVLLMIGQLRAELIQLFGKLLDGNIGRTFVIDDLLTGFDQIVELQIQLLVFGPQQAGLF